jgi:uncharacterized protein HemX
MKNLIGVIILAALCIGLGVVLFTSKKQAQEEKKKDVETILSHSNQWVKTSLELDEQRQVNTALTNDLTRRGKNFPSSPTNSPMSPPR